MRAAALRPRVTAWFLCALLCAWGSPSRAQTTDQPSRPPRMPAPDFLLKRPIGSVGVRGSWVFARAGSDLFAFLHEQLTIDKADFRGPALAIDVARAVTPRLDAVFGLEYGSTSMRSEYRHLVDNDFLPIEQTTALRTFHLIGEVRYAFVPRGYAVSRLAWVPRGMVPYAGAGAGAVWHEFVPGALQDQSPEDVGRFARRSGSLGLRPVRYSYWGFNDYWNSQNIVIIGGGDAPAHPVGGGRVVNGRGYTRIEPVTAASAARRQWLLGLDLFDRAAVR